MPALRRLPNRDRRSETADWQCGSAVQRPAPARPPRRSRWPASPRQRQTPAALRYFGRRTGHKDAPRQPKSGDGRVVPRNIGGPEPRARAGMRSTSPWSRPMPSMTSRSWTAGIPCAAVGHRSSSGWAGKPCGGVGDSSAATAYTIGSADAAGPASRGRSANAAATAPPTAIRPAPISSHMPAP